MRALLSPAHSRCTEGSTLQQVSFAATDTCPVPSGSAAGQGANITSAENSLFPSLPLFYHVLKILPAHASHQPGSCCSQLTLLPKARTSQAQAQLRQGQELLCPHRHSHNGCTTTLPPGSSPSPLAHQQLPCLSPCSPFPP